MNERKAKMSFIVAFAAAVLSCPLFPATAGQTSCASGKVVLFFHDRGHAYVTIRIGEAGNSRFLHALRSKVRSGSGWSSAWPGNLDGGGERSFWK